MNDIENIEKNIIKNHTKRVTCFAHFDKNNTIQDYVIYYLKELKKVSDIIIFVSDSNLPDTEIEKIRPYINHSIAQKHGEYDFGSYKRGYFYAKENNLFENCEELIFANDSCYGPLFPFEDMFNKMTPQNVDFWGVTENNEGITGIIDAYRHIQSYFMVFKSQIFNNELFIDFIKNIKQELSKEEIIAKYEIGLSKFLHEQGFTSDSYCEIAKQIPNAFHSKIKELIIYNQMPIVKRSIFLNSIPDISNSFFKKYTNYDYKLIKKDIKKYGKKLTFSEKIKHLRKRIIIIHLNSHEQKISLFGKTLFDSTANKNSVQYIKDGK